MCGCRVCGCLLAVTVFHVSVSKDHIVLRFVGWQTQFHAMGGLWLVITSILGIRQEAYVLCRGTIVNTSSHVDWRMLPYIWFVI